MNLIKLVPGLLIGIAVFVFMILFCLDFLLLDLCLLLELTLIVDCEGIMLICCSLINTILFFRSVYIWTASVIFFPIFVLGMIIEKDKRLLVNIRTGKYKM